MKISLSKNTLVGLLLIIITIGLLSYFLLIWFSDNSAGRINSFEGFKWGTARKEIFEKFGDPKHTPADTKVAFDDSSSEGLTVVYHQQNIGQDTGIIGFTFHPEHGLVKGYYKLSFSRKRSCNSVFERQFSIIQKTYPDLKLIKKGKFNRLKVKFCHAVLVGKAGRYAAWTDKAGNRITMLLGAKVSNQYITILYESKYYYDWRASTRDSSWLELFLS